MKVTKVDRIRSAVSGENANEEGRGDYAELGINFLMTR